MRPMNTITLSGVLPKVFIGEEDSDRIRNSEVWLASLTFEKGNHYLVSAESGTGKSSMCSFIYGDRIDYIGTIAFNGNSVKNLSIDDWCKVRTTSLSYVPQEMRLFPELSVAENILIKNTLTNRFTMPEIVRMLERLEIENKLHEPAGRLSVGQQQRVAIVRALCQPFDFILLDEPVSHLDERNNKAAASLISDEAAARNAGIITTSVGNHLSLTNPIVVKL